MSSDAPADQGTDNAGKGKRRLFLRGLALLLPTVLTVLILVEAYQFIDEFVIQYVNKGIHQALKTIGFYGVFGEDVVYESPVVQYLLITPIRWFFDKAFGFVLSILFLYAVGLLIGTLVGRRVWQAIESRLMRFPVIRFVYPFIRQVTDFVFSERNVAFRSVVAVEYPRRGMWSIGFLTGHGFDSLQKRVGGNVVRVFVPSSPTPMTGYVVFFPENDVIPLDITVDEAFRLVVSGGVIPPPDRPANARPPAEGEIPPPRGDAPGETR